MTDELGYRLHFAVMENDLKTVNLILNSDSDDVNEFDEISHTPMHYACQNENKQMVELLLSYGADINAQNLVTDAGDTPIGSVAKECSFNFFLYLLDKGATPALKGWMQLNALDRANQRQDEEGEYIIEYISKNAT